MKNRVYRKRMLSFLCCLALLTALAVPAAAATVGYTDIPAGSTLKEEIQAASDYGLMQGYSATIFGYAEKITRAQFAAVLTRMFGWSTVMPASATFSDVPKSHTWYSSVETAAAHDVVDKTGTFRPGDAITRAEMAEMLVRALGLKSAAALTQQAWKSHTTAQSFALPFTDISGDGDSASYIAVAYAIGMTKGTSATTFAPSATATRAQAAAMLVRIYEKLHPSDSWVHGFYAISSYSQISLSTDMNAVSAGWSRMTWDGSAALLSTTSANGNEYYIPSGYSGAITTMASGGASLNLSVFMDVSDGVRDLLASETGRAQAVEQIIDELTVSYKALGKNPYSGVTIDFEGLRSAQKANFTAFLTVLSQKVRALGKSLYVCVSPVLLTGSSYDGYDYQAIAALSDKVLLMAYDYDTQDLSSYVGTEYYKTAAPAPMDQIYASLYLLTAAVTDSSKLALGFSFKNVAWQIDKDGKLLSGTPVYPSMETVEKRLAQSDTTIGWSDTYQMPYAVYTTEDGSRYFLWYENAASVAAKRSTARVLNVTGVSVWRLGTVPAYDDWSCTNLFA